MKLVDVNDWYQRPDFTTPAGRYCGIAIGPESDVGIVRVGRSRLQAGLWLPITATSYAITRDLVPVSVFSEVWSSLPELARLQLVLAECPSELAIDPKRPDGHYRAGGTLGVGGWSNLLNVPFEGRRTARIAVRSTTSLAQVAMQVDGRYFDAAGQVIPQAARIANLVAGGMTGSGGSQTGTSYFLVLGTATNPIVCASLQISLSYSGTGTNVLTVDAMTCGEAVNA